MDSAGNVHVGMIGKDPAGGIYQVKYTGNSSGYFTTPVYITTGGINKATPASMGGTRWKGSLCIYTYVTGADNVYYRWYDPADSSLSPELLLLRVKHQVMLMLKLFSTHKVLCILSLDSTYCNRYPEIL